MGLEVVQCKVDGLPTTPLVISSTSPADRLALDHLGGGFAVATSSVPYMRPDSSSNETRNLRSSFVSFWGFSHNRIPAPLIDFIKSTTSEALQARHISHDKIIAPLILR